MLDLQRLSCGIAFILIVIGGGLGVIWLIEHAAWVLVTAVGLALAYAWGTFLMYLFSGKKTETTMIMRKRSG